MSREVKQGRKFARSTTCMSGVGKTGTGISQFVEERLNHRIDGRQSLGWCVLQKSRDQIDCIWRSLPENLIKRMRLDLRKFVLHVVWIHGADLVARRSSKDFDDLDELVDTRFAWKKWLAQHELCHHAACRPDIDLGGVVCGAEDQLRSAIVSGTNVGNIRFILNQNFCASKIAQLQHSSGRVKQEILRFDISMADAL